MGWKSAAALGLFAVGTIAAGFWLQPFFPYGSIYWFAMALICVLVGAIFRQECWLPQVRAKWLIKRRGGRALGTCVHLDWKGLYEGLSQIPPYLEFRYRLINAELEAVRITAVRGRVTLDGQEIGTPELKKGYSVEIAQGGTQEVCFDLRPNEPQVAHIRDVKSRNPHE